MPNKYRNRGFKFERDLARYFNAHGCITAERRVVASFRTKDRESPDLGDLRDIPGVCVQAKYEVDSYPSGLSGKALDDRLAETMTQMFASGCALPLLIEKRKGHADIGEQWVHIPANYYAALVFGIDPTSEPWVTTTHPIRVELRHIIDYIIRFSAMCAESPEVAA
jgi:hypothetical protein